MISAERWHKEFETMCAVADRLRQQRDELLRAVAPLMDREVVIPFASAWEFEPHNGLGEGIHDRLRAAFEAVDELDRREALQTEDA